MEFNIIKILDGIFIANRTVISDYQFLSNNKISHLVMWFQSPLSTNSFNGQTYVSEKEALQIIKMMGIVEILFTDCNLFPDQIAVENCIQAINQSRDEELCCLILSDNIFDTIWFIIAYLKHRFNWRTQTSFGFIEKKLVNLQISNISQMIQNLRNQYQSRDIGFLKPHNQLLTNNLNKNSQYNFLDNEQSFVEFMQFTKVQTAIDFNLQDSSSQKEGKLIKWGDKGFMQNYTSEDPQEMLLINTIKNMSPIESDLKQNTNKKGRRIKWLDQKSKNTNNSSQKMFANSLINSSLKKNINSNTFFNTPNLGLSNIRPSSGKISILDLKNENRNKQGIKIKSVLKSSQSQNQLTQKSKLQQLQIERNQPQIIQDELFQQLKQLSRTNFSEMANFNRRLNSNKKKIEKPNRNKYESNRFVSNGKQNLLKSQSMECLGLPATFNESKKCPAPSRKNNRKKISLNMPIQKKQNQILKLPSNIISFPLRDRKSSEQKMMNSRLAFSPNFGIKNF